MGSRFGPVSGPKRGGSQRRSVLGLLFGSESGPVAGPVLGHFWILSLAGSGRGGGTPSASGRPGGPAAGPGKKAARAEGWRRTAPRPQHSAPRCTAPRPRCTAPRRAARRCTAVACAPLRLNRCLRATALEQGGAGAVPLASRRSASALDARQECAGSVARGGGRAETVQARSKYCKRLHPCRPYRAVFGDPALGFVENFIPPPCGLYTPPLPHKIRFRASTGWLGGAKTQMPVAFLRILLPRWCDMSPPPTAFYPPTKTCFEIPGWPDYWKRAPPSLTTLPPLQVCSLLQYGALVPCLRRRRAAYCTAAAPHLRRSYVVSAQPVASDRSATATQCSAVTPLVGRGAGISMLARGC